MTLTEARKTLERRRLDTPFDDELAEAIDTAISVLPAESRRPTTGKRLAAIRASIRDAKGFDPFSSRDRRKDMVCWRQCVWLQMQNEGYRTGAIGSACGYNHATVWWGVDRLRGYLSSGDRFAAAVWEDFNGITGHSDLRHLEGYVRDE